MPCASGSARHVTAIVDHTGMGGTPVPRAWLPSGRNTDPLPDARTLSDCVDGANEYSRLDRTFGAK
jgi:hypothetical protein